MSSFGEFLYQLRKEKGLTQQELAEKLGVSNKAVSKWETGEAMPETSQLLPLSKIFEVSVDELLNGERENKKTDKSLDEEKDKFDNSTEIKISKEGEKEESFNLKQHLFSRGKNDKDKTFLEILTGLVCGSIVLIGLITYLLLGVIGGLWHPYWVIMPCSALASGIAGIAFDFFNKPKRQKKLSKGENPYMGGVCGIVMLSCIIIYLLLGAILNLWHPCWIICVAGGVACGILGMLGNLLVFNKKTDIKK